MRTPAPVPPRGIGVIAPAASLPAAGTRVRADIRRRPARPAGWWAIGTLAVVIAAVLTWQHFQRVALRLECDLLREQLGELAALRATNAGLRRAQASPDELLLLRADHAALARLRAELAQIRAGAEAGAAARAQRATTGVRVPPPPVRSVHEMRNLGAATPQACGETFIWALQHGEIDAAAGLIQLAPDARARAQAVLASMPLSFRSEYATPERFLAFVLAGSGGTAGIRVLSEAVQDNRAVQRLELQAGDGHSRFDAISFERAATGWRRVIPLRTVDMVAAYLSDRPAPVGKPE